MQPSHAYHTARVCHATRAPLLPKLRGHFAEFLDEGSLARLRILSLPTCVGLWYGHLKSSLEAFLGSVGSATSLLGFAPLHSSGLTRRFFLPGHPKSLDALFHSRAWPTLLRHPFLQSALRWYRNLNRLPIGYASRPHLRSRLTLGGRAFPRKPSAFGE